MSHPSRRGPRARLLRALLALALVAVGARCGDDGPPLASVAPDHGAGLGEGCSPARLCAQPWLCVDGSCAARLWPPAPEADAAVSIPDIPWPPQDTGVGDIAADTEGPSDGQGDGPGPDASDGDEGGPTTYLVSVTEDDAEANPGDLGPELAQDEAWVSQLYLPAAGVLSGLQVIVADPPGGPSCGLFLPTLWVKVGGSFPSGASWTAPEPVPLEGSESPRTLLFESGPALPVGDVRVGLVRAGLCEDAEAVPRVLADGTGASPRTLVYRPGAPQTPWLPASDLGVTGRWAMRIILAVEAGGE